jgi:hypothetical protein
MMVVQPNQGASWRHYGPDVILIVILVLLPVLFFWRIVTPYPTDRNHITAGDFDQQYFPLRAFAAEEWVNGRVPLWNPYIYGGQPALADIQSGALYPLHVVEALSLGWGAPLLGYEIGFPLWALEWQMIIHFSLAAVGTYLFVRYENRRHTMPLRRARFGGLIAALVFTFSGYLTGFPVQQLTILEVSAWLPWLLWGLSATLWRAGDPAANHQSPGSGFSLQPFLAGLWPAAWAALTLAMAILAGHPQTVLYIFYLTAAYTLFRAWTYWNQNRYGPWYHYPITVAALWLLIILVGLAIAAAQLLPTLEFISHSLRADLSFQAVSAGLPLTELVSILYPGFFGGSPIYVGIASLVLVALALTMAKPRPFIYFWAGAGLVSLLTAFGRNLFMYPLFYLIVPGFDAVRQQERIFLVFSFSAAMLAGYGALTLVGPMPRVTRQTLMRFEHRFRIAAMILFVITALFIYGATAATARNEPVNLFFGVLRHHIFGLVFLGGMLVLLAVRSRRWLSRWWGMALVATWVAFNLFTVNWRFNLADPSEPEPFRPNGAVQFLQQNLTHAPGRVASGGLLPGGNSAASIYNLEDITGNTPLQLAAMERFLSQMPAWRLWQLTNVRYIVENRDVTDPGLKPVWAEDDLKVFEIGDPFERAWFVNEVEVLGSALETTGRLASPDFDLRRTAMIAQPLTIALTDSSASAVTVTDFGPTQLELQVHASGEHLLVISQTFYPGWQAEIDGQPVEVIRANLVQQAVVVPPGSHLIRLTYWPGSLSWGLVISAAGLLVCGVILVIKR